MPLLLNQVVDFSNPIRTPWTMWAVVKFENDPSGRLTLAPALGAEGVVWGDGTGINVRIAGVNHNEHAYAIVAITGVAGQIWESLEIPIDDWFYLEARQTATKVWLRVNDTEISMDAVPIDPTYAENEVQIGGMAVLWDLAFFQECNIAVRCADLETHRWELQDKFDFPRSPITDCTDDIVTGSRHFFAVYG